MTIHIGLLVGMEDDMPPAFIERVHKNAGYHADFIKLGGIPERQTRDYDVIIDRISHEVPFYRFFLKTAQLAGTYVINDPHWWAADDKFFGYSLAAKLGLAVPRTILLPQKDYIPAIDKKKSLRNLTYPLDWQGIANYIGFPAILKPADGGGWKNVTKVHDMAELFRAYDESTTLAMTLQEFIDFDEYVRCLCIGHDLVLPIKYDPKHRRYVPTGQFLGDELERRIVEDSYKINQALSYDMNSVEFAVKGGVPYAIDFTNPAPDMYSWSLGEPYYDIVVDELVRFAMKAGKEREARTQETRAPWTGRHEYAWRSASAGELTSGFTMVGGDAPGRRATRGTP